MDYRPCTHCNKDIPVQAHACWHCGEALANRFAAGPISEDKHPVLPKLNFLARILHDNKAA